MRPGDQQQSSETQAIRNLSDLLENNRRWAASLTQVNPDFFADLVGIQNPRFLWIGCSDSRVPANQIVDLRPGEMFVHRNIANLAPNDDPNCQSVVQFAVDVLRVENIIVCGHYGCGGVKAALGDAVSDPLETWLEHLRVVAKEHSDELDALPEFDDKWRRLCELNVLAQVETLSRMPVVRRTLESGHDLTLHSWIYDLQDGIIRDLGLT